MQIEKQNQEKQYLGQIIQQGLSGEVSLIGFPYDMGAERDKIQNGQENGPDCMRRFLPKTGPLKNFEYNIDITNMNIQDYGNIMIPDKYDQILEEVIEKLQTKVTSVFNKGNIPFVLGGTKDCSYSAVKSLLENKENPICINIQAGYDLNRMFEGNKISMTSGMSKLIQENQEIIDKKQFQIHYFGIQNQLVNQDSQNLLNKYKDKIIFSTAISQIRRFQIQNISQNIFEPITQAGIIFKQKLDQLQGKNIHLSISLESIIGSEVPGVTRPSVVGGLNCEEITEILFQAGLSQNIVSIDITDYNPSKEDYRTGMLFSNLVYYFIMGVQKKKELKQLQN